MCAARSAGSQRASASCPLDLSIHTRPRVRPHIRHVGRLRSHNETTAFNTKFSLLTSRKVTTQATRFVHPYSWPQPTKTPTFQHQHNEKSTLQQHVVSYKPNTLSSFNGKAPGRVARGFPCAGADDGNRTRVICLEGRGSTIELHPRTPEGDTKILAGIVHVRDIYTRLPYDGAPDTSPTGCSAAW